MPKFVIYALADEFGQSYQYFPSIVNRLPIKNLPVEILEALIVTSATEDRLELFQRLVEGDIFSLNFSYNYNGVHGNAIIFLAKSHLCLRYALERGLDLRIIVRVQSSDKEIELSVQDLFVSTEILVVIN